MEATRGRREFAWSLAVPVGYFTVAWLALPVSSGFEFSPDEGINLIKGLLHARGHALYRDVWSDQPPLLTLVLSRWFDWFGPSVPAARGLVLGCACLLLWAFHATLRPAVGRVAATLATLGLLLSRHFVRLSVSVMVGLPGVALALVGIHALYRYRRGGGWPWLLASGLWFALGLQVKLFTAFLIPLLLVQIALPRGAGAVRGRGGPAVGVAAWLAGLAAGTLPFLLIVHPEGWDQLVGAHLTPAVRDGFGDRDALHDYLQLFAYHQPVLLLAAIGAVGVARRRLASGFLPTAWLAAGALVLALHRPIWYHHVLLLSVPLFWLAGYGIRFCLEAMRPFPRTAGFDALDARGRRAVVVLAGCLVLSAATLGMSLSRQTLRLFQPAPPCDAALLAGVRERAQGTRWIYTDRPMFAYRAGLSAPPDTAVFTLKRLRSGNLSEARILATLADHRPEQVLLGRFPQRPAVRAAIEARYQRVLRCESGVLFVARRPPGGTAPPP